MSSPTPAERAPADAGDRERIRTAIGETLFVEAGAGTGKTTALVTRICSLVVAGVPIGAIAAITFTEAAAAELRDRIRVELEKLAIGEGDEDGRAAAALAGLDAAAIQTLHGFARRILALYPLEAGLPPRFDVRDSLEMAAAFDDRWGAFVSELFNETGPDPRLPRALTLGLTVKHLRTLAQLLHDNYDRLQPTPGATGDPVEVEVSGLVTALRDALELRGMCSDPGDKLLGHLERLERLPARLEALATRIAVASDDVSRTVAEQDLLADLAALKPFAPGNLGNAKSWTTGHHAYKPDVTSALKEADGARLGLLNDVRRDCIESVLPRLIGWALDGAAERRRDGTLEYHDLLVLSVRLLRGDAVVRRTLNRRFTHLLIDEFQDTDPLQIELAALLATTAHEVGETPWQGLPVAPGSLFFVGDPRQSIYRFRRAEIEVYEAAGAAFAPEPVHLTANFRSKRGIVSWANDLFAHIFGMPYGSGPDTPAQAAYTPLGAHQQGDAPVVYVIGGPSDGRSGEIRATEAGEIAALIRAALANDWLKKTRPGAPARFADVTILIPDRNALPPLERALESADIPFRVEGSTLLFGTQEVRDFTNILAAIDDPADEVAVVAALRSPAFACGDDELYAFRQLRRTRTWDYTSQMGDEIPADNRVRQAMGVLAELYEQRSWLSNAELVETVIRERRLFELAFSGERQRDMWQRLRFLHEQARRFDASSAGTLRHFVGWLRESAKSGAHVTESVVPDPDDDAVRVMTIHASKGLEFPIVFVAGLLPEPRTQRAAVLFDRGAAAAAQPQVSVGNKDMGYFRTPGYELLGERERVMERLERDRLLYVAATRARDCLVVTAYHRAHKTPHDQRHLQAGCSLAECIHAACEQLPHLRGSAPAIERTMRMEFPPAQGEPPDLDARAGWIAGRLALVTRNSRPHTLAATAIAHAGEEPPEKPEPREDEHAPWRRGRAGTAIGRAVHAVLQTIDHATLEGLHDAARAQSAAEGVPDRAREIADLVRTACASQPVRDALASGRSWRELYVATPIETGEGTVLVEGFVDLLYRTADGYSVVDYKTDAVRGEADIDRAMEGYRLQGAAYALALEAQLDAPVTRFECVFVTPNKVRTVSGEGLRAAIEDARARVSALGLGQETSPSRAG